jgi:tight adherence protein B
VSTWVTVVLVIAAGVVAASGVRRLGRARAVARLGIEVGGSAHAVDVDRNDVIVSGAAALIAWVWFGPEWAALAIVVVLLGRRFQARRTASVPPVVVQERFADAIAAIAAAVRAGSSLPQAIRFAAQEAEPPIRKQLEQLVGQLDMGVPLDDAVDAWARGVETADGDLVAGALDLHRRSGGDLPAVLDQVTATIRDRVGIAREVRSLTAQGRLSAWILGVLPVGFFAFLWLTAREEIDGALSTRVGLACIVVGLVLEAGAFLWIRSLLVVA